MYWAKVTYIRVRLSISSSLQINVEFRSFCSFVFRKCAKAANEHYVLNIKFSSNLQISVGGDVFRKKTENLDLLSSFPCFLVEFWYALQESFAFRQNWDVFYTNSGTTNWNNQNWIDTSEVFFKQLFSLLSSCLILAS